MSQNTAARTVTANDHGKLDIRALVLLAILLAAGLILNFTVGKAISSMSAGMISPEFIISAFCLTILIVRPNIGQALVIGLISAAVIQITTTSPFIDFAAEGISAMVMAVIVRAGMRGGAAQGHPLQSLPCHHPALRRDLHAHQDDHGGRRRRARRRHAARSRRHRRLQRHPGSGPLHPHQEGP